MNIIKNGMLSYSKTKHLSLQKSGEGKPVLEIEFQKQAKELDITPAPTVKYSLQWLPY